MKIPRTTTERDISAESETLRHQLREIIQREVGPI